VTVSGEGSKWTNSGFLRVGVHGNGTLEITNGATVINTRGDIGDDYNSTGAVTVSGIGSTWTNSGDLYVGHKSSGTLDITNGGVVSSADSRIGDGHNITCAVMVSGDGSTWTNSGDLYVGYYGEAGLTIDDGGLVKVDGELTIDSNGGGDSFVNMGIDGTLAIYGDADHSLAIFLATIRGSGEIRYWDDDISDWASILGATSGEDYTLAYNAAGDLAGYTVLSMGVVLDPPTPGDTNDDDIVDTLDLTNLVAQFGGPPDVESGDFTGDVFVGLEDFAIMRDNYGFGLPTAPDAGSATTTPEPATLTLLALGGLAVLRRTRR